MQIISAHSPQYTPTGDIDITVYFADLGEVPFTATPSNDYGLFARAVAGEFGPVTPFVLTLADAIAAKLIQIERDRDFACIANVTAHGRTWQADSRSQSLLGQAIMLASAGLPLPAVWRDADNGDMAITGIADLLAIAGAIAAQVQTAYAVSWARKAAVESADTVSAVDVI
jgi:hypothetical protein